MIGTTLAYLRKRVDGHLRTALLLEDDGSSADRVIFVDGDKLEPLTIAQSAISMLVVNVEEERELRSADPYRQMVSTSNNGIQIQQVYPEIRLIVSILFIARYKDYVSAWNYLAEVISFFQSNPVLDAENDPNLPKEIDRIASEMVSHTHQQQNEVWSALRITQHPAILYRLKLVILRDRQPRTVHDLVKTVETRVGGKQSDRPGNLLSPPATNREGGAIRSP